MPDLRIKIAAAGTAAALGGLGAVALGTQPTDKSAPKTAAADTLPVTEVRTQVIHQTIHRTKREKPKVAAAPPAAVAPPRAAQAAAAPVRVRTVAASAPTTVPVRTRSSTTGSSGSRGREIEREIEREDDHGSENDD